MPEPMGELDRRYSGAGATAPAWSAAEALLRTAELFWISTVRPDGRPHATPLLAVWDGGALHFATGAGERKARNLDRNPEVVLTTGAGAWDEGYNLAVEGTAVRVTEDGRLRGLAAAWAAKYGSEWRFGVGDGCFEHGPGRATVFAVAPRVVLGFGRFAEGEPLGQTRWRFG
ncbi:pyridoxamine 5'-phosphate oxidase family protein [Streptomyces sp. NPDC056161]|uniref:pyridoxamine 5'-phosphate oxidase family protein n=1 Tax=Streptomyces sp. NPDC056161 TaxID=3345732 RepID=UPI0035DC6AFD